jgi:hypothetical protein
VRAEVHGAFPTCREEAESSALEAVRNDPQGFHPGRSVEGGFLQFPSRPKNLLNR